MIDNTIKTVKLINERAERKRKKRKKKQGRIKSTFEKRRKISRMKSSKIRWFTFNCTVVIAINTIAIILLKTSVQFTQTCTSKSCFSNFVKNGQLGTGNINTKLIRCSLYIRISKFLRYYCTLVSDLPSPEFSFSKLFT